MRDYDGWLKLAQDVLSDNRVTFRYTRPAPNTYEQQWLWDSCFHAIVLRHFDPQMARDELLSAVAHQFTDGPDAGMIPHMTYWRGGGRALWGRDDRSVITQPPLVGVAAWLVYEKTGDAALLQQLYEPLARYHDWFERRRDPDGDNLVSLIHPWESGWDASPRWDGPMSLGADPTDDEARQARLELVEKLMARGCDAAALAQDGLFHVEAADFNAIRAADLESLAKIAGALGRTGDAAHWQARARAVQGAVQAKMARVGFVYDLAGPDEAPLAEQTAAAFVTLFGGCAAPDTAAALVEKLQSPDWWPRYPVPTTPVSARSFRPDRYWRGNVWLNVNWLIWAGLRRCGHDSLAAALAERSLALVEDSCALARAQEQPDAEAAGGLYEYFNPLTADGRGSRPHSWSALVLDMLAQPPAG